MKKVSKRDFDAFGILIGVVIGIVMGYLFGSKVDINIEDNDSTVSTEVKEDYIYLLQLGKYSDVSSATNVYNELINKNINCIYVNEGNNYFIYASISTKEEDIIKVKEAYSLIGYNGIIKKEYLYDRSNSVIDNEREYHFYNQMIKSLYDSLNDEQIVIEDELLMNPVDIELVTWVNMLSSIKNDDYKNKIELQTYKMIVEKIK